MKKVFTHENRFYVWNIKHELDRQGIPAIIKNEFALGAVGELAPLDVWPEVWITKNQQYEAAINCIKRFEQQRENTTLKKWICSQCEEHNDGNFEICWNCGTAKIENPN